MAELEAVRDRLKAILDQYRSRLVVTADGPGGMILEMPGYEGKPWGYVAGIRVLKRYVSFYLMGVYGQPDLLESISPELRQRMQGKACFNFTKVDEPLFNELDALTSKAIARHPEVVAEVVAGSRRR